MPFYDLVLKQKKKEKQKKSENYDDINENRKIENKKWTGNADTLQLINCRKYTTSLDWADHFSLKKIVFRSTESRFFIGLRPSP